VLVLLWCGFRIVPGHAVIFPKGEAPVLLGNDPWFHLHQTRGAAEHFPRLTRWDTGSNYPRGSYAAPAGLYNLTTAAVALVIGRGEPPPELIAAIIASSPLVFGLVALFFFYALAHEWGGHRLALFALAIRVFFPGSELDRTVIGFGDYHVVEICLATLGLWLFLRFSRLVETKGKTSVRWFKAWAAGLPFGIFLFVWTGAPLHLAALLVAFAAAWAHAMLRGRADARLAGHFAPYFAGLFFTVAIPGWLFPDLVMIESGFRITLVALVVQTLFCLWAQRGLPGLARKIGLRKTLLLVAAVGTLVLLAFYLSSERIRDLAGTIAGERNPFIAEHQRVDLRLVWETYGLLAIWILPGIIGMLRSASFAKETVTVYLVIWLGLWVMSSDFAYLIAALGPLLLAIGMRDFPGAIRSAAGLPGSSLRLLPMVAVLVTGVVLIPLEKVRAPFLPRGDVAGMVVATPPWREAMAWLKTETAKPPLAPTHLAAPWSKGRGFDYPAGSYGVLCHWQYGNLIPALGDRVAVSARTRSGTFIEWFLEQDEAASHARLSGKGEVRYVIVDAASVAESFPGEALQAGMERDAFQVVEETIALGEGDIELLSFGDDFRAAIGARLYLGDGPGMSRYRLVYESPQQSFLRYRAFPEIRAVELRSTLVENEAMREKILPLTVLGESWTEPGPFFCYSGQMSSAVKIFERVPGATVSGDVAPLSKVKIELDLFSPFTGRRFTYRQSATAAAEGQVSFILPYAGETSADRPSHPQRVHATGPYRFSVEGRDPIALEVPEKDVLAGSILSLPVPVAVPE